jgi:hypothetical protein
VHISKLHIACHTWRSSDIKARPSLLHLRTRENPSTIVSASVSTPYSNKSSCIYNSTTTQSSTQTHRYRAMLQPNPKQLATFHYTSIFPALIQESQTCGKAHPASESGYPSHFHDPQKPNNPSLSTANIIFSFHTSSSSPPYPNFLEYCLYAPNRESTYLQKHLHSHHYHRTCNFFCDHLITITPHPSITKVPSTSHLSQTYFLARTLPTNAHVKQPHTLSTYPLCSIPKSFSSHLTFAMRSM